MAKKALSLFLFFLIFIISAIFGVDADDEAPTIDGCDKDHDLVCPEGWEIKESCGGKVYCYRSHQVPVAQRNLKSLMGDMCAQAYKGSKTLSIQCEDENDYLWKFGNFAIGLYLPPGEQKGSKNWKWVDGSPYNWIPTWDKVKNPAAPYFEGKTAEDYNVVYYKADTGRYGWIDRWSNGFSQIICKMPAAKVKKTQPCSSTQNLEMTLMLPIGTPRIIDGCAKIYDFWCPPGWKMWESCGKVQCYNDYWTKKEEQTLDWVMKDICTRNFNESKTISIHCAKENEMLWKYDNFLLGLYVPPNKPVIKNEWQWTDGSAWDYSFWEFYQNKLAPYHIRGDEDRVVYFRQDYGRYGWVDDPIWSPAISHTVCKQPALKIQRSFACAPEPQSAAAIPKQNAPVIDICDTEHNLVCPDVWELKENCGKVYCYRSLEVAPEQRTLKWLISDMCAQNFEGSQTLSIHCEEENQYVWKFDNFPIGLYLPPGEPKRSSKWKWVDGSVIDYGGYWDSNLSPGAPYFEGNDYNIVFYKGGTRRFGWIDRPQTFEGFSRIVCKMPASKVKKPDGCPAQPSEIISNLPKLNPPIKEACAKVYDYKCPEGWNVWETCGTIKCYRMLPTKLEERTIEWHIKDICAFHFNGSKTLSIHCDKEFELLWQFNNFIVGLYIPPNKPITSNEWQWVDGSPVDYTCWEKLNGKVAPFRERDVDRVTMFRALYGRYGWVDNPTWAPAFSQIICKQPAIKVERIAKCASPTPPQVTTTPIIRKDPTVKPSIIPPRRTCHI